MAEIKTGQSSTNQTGNVAPGTTTGQTLYWNNGTLQWVANSAVIWDTTNLGLRVGGTAANVRLKVQPKDANQTVAQFLNFSGGASVTITNNATVQAGTYDLINAGLRGRIVGSSTVAALTLVIGNTADFTTNALVSGYLGAGIGDQFPLARVHSRTNTLGNEVYRGESPEGGGTYVTTKQKHGYAATTDATVTTILTIAIPTDDVLSFRVKVKAIRTGGAAVGGSVGDAAIYVKEAAYKNLSGTVTQVGAVDVLVAEQDATWDVTYNISTTNVQIQVTGDVDKNITWNAEIQTLE